MGQRQGQRRRRHDMWTMIEPTFLSSVGFVVLERRYGASSRMWRIIEMGGK